MTTQITPDRQMLQKAQTLFMNGQTADSEQLFKILASSPVVGPQAQCGLGMIHLSRGEVGEAQAVFMGVVAGGHRVAEAHYGLGRIAEKSDPGYARAQYEFALGINPGHRGAQTRRRGLTSTREADVPNPGPTPTPNPPPALPTHGTATHVKTRTEQRGGGIMPLRQVQIVEFRLQRNGLEPVPVFMQGNRLRGTIRDGDQIVLPGKPRPRAVYQTRKVYNETAGGTVTTTGGVSYVSIFLALVVFVGASFILMSIFKAKPPRRGSLGEPPRHVGLVELRPSHDSSSSPLTVGVVMPPSRPA
jgi:hypothetical protein